MKLRSVFLDHWMGVIEKVSVYKFLVQFWSYYKFGYKLTRIIPFRCWRLFETRPVPSKRSVFYATMNGDARGNVRRIFSRPITTGKFWALGWSWPLEILINTLERETREYRESHMFFSLFSLFRIIGVFSIGIDIGTCKTFMCST